MTSGTLLSDSDLAIVRYRARVLLLLDAAERAGIAPLSTPRFHVLAYLADVLSPVWGLRPFDGKVLKNEGGPHYPDLQKQIDVLVALRLIDVFGLKYIDRPNEGARIDASYALRFDAPELPKILAALGAAADEKPLDGKDRQAHQFVAELAGALATLGDDQIDAVASIDVTYADSRIAVSNIVDFASWTSEPQAENPSVLTMDRFSSFLPEGASLTPAEKLYLYAVFLRRRISDT